jgi:eukaryotic-like serine/threonine-protein kinase
VAVKILESINADDAFRRMTRELRMFATVRSPYLVALFDAGQQGDRFFYSMEYFPLGSLALPARPLDRGERLRAVAHAARAAHALHEAGAVHRAIKPANIMVHPGGGKLADLGLAQLLRPGQTLTGVGPIGSVEHLDPGLLRGQRGSRSSDVWSLGTTLHRVLAGIGVYGELPDREPLVAVRRVLTSRPNLSDELDDGARRVVARALAAEPAQRYPTADALADDIDALV